MVVSLTPAFIKNWLLRSQFLKLAAQLSVTA